MQVDGFQEVVGTGTMERPLRQIFNPLASGLVLLPESQHGLLIGARDVAYLIELNPPSIVDVLHLGHGPGSVATDPIRMGPLVLVAENDRSDGPV